MSLSSASPNSVLQNCARIDFNYLFSEPIGVTSGKGTALAFSISWSPRARFNALYLRQRGNASFRNG